MKHSDDLLRRLQLSAILPTIMVRTNAAAAFTLERLLVLGGKDIE